MKKINGFLISLPLIFGSSLVAGQAISQNNKQAMLNNETNLSQKEAIIGEDFDSYTSVEGTKDSIEINWNYDYMLQNGGIESFKQIEVTISDESTGVEVFSETVEEVTGVIIAKVSEEGNETGKTYTVEIVVSYDDSATKGRNLSITTEGAKTTKFSKNGYFNINQESISQTGFDFSFGVFSGGQYKEYDPEEAVLYYQDGIGTESHLLTQLNLNVISSETVDTIETVNIHVSGLKPETTYSNFSLGLTKSKSLLINAKTVTTKDEAIYVSNSFSIDEESVTSSSFEFNFLLKTIDISTVNKEDLKLISNDKELVLDNIIVEKDLKSSLDVKVSATAINLEAKTTYQNFQISTGGLPSSTTDTAYKDSKVTTLVAPFVDSNSFVVLNESIIDNSFKFTFTIEFPNDEGEELTADNLTIKADSSSSLNANVDIELADNVEHTTIAKKQETFTVQAINLDQETTYSNFSIGINENALTTMSSPEKVITEKSDSFDIESFEVIDKTTTSFDFSFSGFEFGYEHEFKKENILLYAFNGKEQLNLTNINLNEKTITGTASDLKDGTFYNDLELSVTGSKKAAESILDDVKTDSLDAVKIDTLDLEDKSARKNSFVFSFLSPGTTKEDTELIVKANEDSGSNKVIELTSEVIGRLAAPNGRKIVAKITDLDAGATYSDFIISVDGGENFVDVNDFTYTVDMPQGNGLTVGEIIGIVIGALLLLGVLIVVILSLKKSPKEEELAFAGGGIIDSEELEEEENLEGEEESIDEEETEENKESSDEK